MKDAKKKHVKGLLRASAYFAALGVGAGVFSVRAARGEVAERSMAIGRQMEKLAEATDHDLNQITIDGQSMWVGSSASKDSPKNILDRYEAYCTENAAQPGASWRDLADKTEAATTIPLLRTGVLRGGDDKEGSVLCFTHTNESKPTIKEALYSLAKTGDLGALGSVRYVYAHRTERGNTVVLTAWTDERFDLLALTPTEGKDVPGAELPEIPRPPNADRILATRVEGTPFGINAYRGKGAPGAVVAFYDDAMQKKGWFALDPELAEKDDESVKPHETTARLYEKDGVVLTIASRLDDGATFTHLGLAGVPAESSGPFEGVKKR